MSADLDHWIARMKEPQTLDQLLQLLAALPPDTPFADLLAILREDRANDASTTLAVAARSAPLAFAIAYHTHGRNLKDEYGRFDLSLPLLQIAAHAYAWANDATGQARATMTLADAYHGAEQYEQALIAAETAYRLFTDLQRPDGQAKSLLVQANTCTDLGYAKQASNYYAQLEPLIAANPPIDRIFFYIDWGRLLEELLDDFAQAQLHYAQAEQLLADCKDATQDDETRHVAFKLYLNQGVLALRLGEHQLANAAFTKAAGCVGDQDRHMATLSIYRGYRFLLLGDEQQAHEQLRNVERIEGLGAPDAEAHSSETQRREAELAWLRAQLSGANTMTLLEQAEHIYQQLDDRINAAAQRLAARFGHAPPISSAPLRMACERIRLLYQTQHVREARELLNKTTGAATHADLQPIRETLAQLRAYDPSTRTDEIQALAAHFAQQPPNINHLELLNLLGDRLKADPTQALAIYQQAIAATEQVRTLLPFAAVGPRLKKARWKPYEAAFLLHVATDPSAAYQMSELARAQLLRDELVAEQPTQPADDDPDWQRIHTLAQERRFLLARSVPNSLRTTRSLHTTTSASVRQELDRIERELVALRAQLTTSHPTRLLNELATAPMPTLDTQTTLVAYFGVETAQPGMYDLWVLVLNAQAPPATICIEAFEVQDFIDEWNEKQVRLTLSTGLTPDGLLSSLYELLVAPIIPLVQGKQLIFVLDERLPQFPLHAALMNDSRYLIEKYSCSYTPSGSVLAYCQQRAKQRTVSQTALIGGWQGRNRELWAVKNELHAIEQVLAAHFSVTHLPPEPTATVALTHMANAGVIHLACHGSFPTKSHPRFAYLELGHDETQNLYAYDLYAAQLHSDLVTFSACETGLQGDSLQGLVSAALVAGASSVVASLWSVNDEATRALMTHLYTNLFAPGSRCGRAEALARAQRAMISAGKTPYEWAAFFLSGLPDPLPTAI